MSKLAALIVSACFIFLSHGAHAFDPAKDYRRLQTQHFEIIFESSQEILAKAYALESERAYTTLQAVFTEFPSSRIAVVLADRTDMANGLATYLPYPMIIVYPVWPSAADSISYYDNWPYELMLHELTHILSFYPAHGIMRPLSWIFGTVVRPNAVLPRWYLEGMAVELETRYTQHGRLRSPSTSAALRALAKDDRLQKETIDKINEVSIPSWPFGQRPYLFGSLLWQELTRRKGPSIIDELNQHYSRRIPFFINPPVEKQTGESYQGLWRAVWDEVAQKAEKQIEKIGVVTERSFIGGGGMHQSPVISPDGRHLAYIEHDAYAGGQVRVISRAAGDKTSFSKLESRVLHKGSGMLKIDWLPDSSGVIFDKIGIHNRHYTFRDLYRLPLSGGKPERLTKGLRAQEPSVSPNGNWVVFVQNDPTGQRLSVLNLKSRSIRHLVRAQVYSRIASPEFIADRRIAFCLRHRDGKEEMRTFDLSSNKANTVLPGFTHVAHPRLTKQGLMFSSHQTGLRLPYLASADLKKAIAVAKTHTEIQEAVWDPAANELLLVELTGKGPRIAATTMQRQVRPQQVEPLLAASAPGYTSTSMPKVSYKESDYSSLKYLLPRYWIPFIFPVEGGVLLQGFTDNVDPLGRHRYHLEGTFDTVTEKAGYGVEYTNSVTPVDISALYSEYHEQITADSDPLTQRGAGMNLASFIPKLSNGWRIHAGYVRLETETTTEKLLRQGPSGGIQYSSSLMNIGNPQAAEYFVSLRHSEFLPGPDSVSHGKTNLAINGAWRAPFTQRHRISLQLKGSYAPKLELNDIVQLGERTIGGNYLVSLINSTNVLRGYPSGALVGRQLYTANFDYRFPLSDIYRGRGLFPLFLQSLTGGVFADVAAVDGAYFDPELEAFFRTKLDKQYWGAGAEFILNSTVAYHLPVTFTVGLYYGFDKEAGGGFMPFLSLGYVGHSGTDHSPTSVNSMRSRPPSFAR